MSKGGLGHIIFDAMSGVGIITFDAIISFLSFLPNANSTQYAGYDGIGTASEQHWRKEQKFQMNLNALN